MRSAVDEHEDRDAARIGPGQRALDVACGTGALAREAEKRVGSAGFVAGVDPDPGMLAVAEELAPAVEWRQGAAEAVPYSDQTFDAVVNALRQYVTAEGHVGTKTL